MGISVGFGKQFVSLTLLIEHKDAFTGPIYSQHVVSNREYCSGLAAWGFHLHKYILCTEFVLFVH